MERQLELQKFHYFDEGNTYAGQKPRIPIGARCSVIW